MIDACTSCGAPVPASFDGYSFVCGFCKAKNVDEAYFKKYAASIDAGKSNRLFQLGVSSYVAGDYSESQKHLQASAVEDDANADAWLYLGLCMAATAKPSNFERNFAAASDYVKKATARGENAEPVQLGQIEIANRFLKSGITAATYYFDTGAKKYLAFGEDRNAAKLAANEFDKGFSLLSAAFDLDPKNSGFVARASVLGLAKCFALEDMKASVPSQDAYKKRFASIAAGAGALQEKALAAAIEGFPAQKKQLAKALGDAKPRVESRTVQPVPPKSEGEPSPPSQASPTAGRQRETEPVASQEQRRPQGTQAASERSRGLRNWGVVAAVVGTVLLAAGYFVYSSSKSRQIAEQKAEEVQRQLLAEQQRVGQEQKAREQERHQREQERQQEARRRAEMEEALKRQSQPDPAAAQPPAVQPQQTLAPAQATSGKAGEWGASTAAVVEILKTASARNWAGVDDQVRRLKAQPPAIPTGDRRSARKINDEGLQALRRGDFAGAVRSLESAVAADERDVEVRNNLGFAYYRAGRLVDSVNSLVRVLALAPDRTSAWTNLSQSVADQGNQGAAVAALRLAVRHSANRVKTQEFLTQTANTTPSAKFKDAIDVVMREMDSIPRSPNDSSGAAQGTSKGPQTAASAPAKAAITPAQPSPIAPAPAASLRRDPQELCRSKSNIISRAICESRACENEADLRDHPYCVRLRKNATQAEKAPSF
jgi:hypothetical protein